MAHDPFDDIEEFYKYYGERFKAADMDAINAMFEYPYLLTNSEGIVEMPDGSFYEKLLKELKAAGWTGSRLSNWRKLRMGKDGAVIVVDYMRTRADGTDLNGNTTAYFLRHRPDGWKLVGIHDGYGSLGAPKLA